MFNQVVIAMASHGYLGLEGGQLMIEFVVSQCALNVDDKALVKLSTEEVTPTSLRDMSCKSLLLITTTIENMDTVTSLLLPLNPGDPGDQEVSFCCVHVGSLAIPVGVYCTSWLHTVARHCVPVCG